MTCQSHQTSYTDRAKAAREQAQTASAIAAEVQSRTSQLRHSDPEFDAAGRVAQLYRQIADTLLDLAETFELYASQNPQPVAVSA